MTELKPCPFCNGIAEIIKVPNKTTGRDSYDIRHIGVIGRSKDRTCILDGFDGLYLYDTEEEVIEAWNRRVNE